MKKLISIILIILCFPVITAAAFSQEELHNSIDKAEEWMYANSEPLNSVGATASDYFIMALKAADKPYSYTIYKNALSKNQAATDKDIRRNAIALTACGEKPLAENLKKSTYSSLSENAAELAEALITLDSGGYTIDNTQTVKENIIYRLLSMQQNDGSFGSDIYDTACSIIALAPYREYSFQKEEDNSILYNTDNAVLNAVIYLENTKNDDFGYSGIRNTAFSVIALNYLGIDADKDPSFSDGIKSPIEWILSRQNTNGGFGTADDTAFAMCAIVSQLNAMTGEKLLFKFTDNTYLTENAENGIITVKEENFTTEIISVEKEQISQEPSETVQPVIYERTAAVDNRNKGIVFVIIAALLALAAIIGFIFTVKYPDKINKLLNKRNRK